MLNQAFQEQKIRKQKIAQFIKIGEIAEKAGIGSLDLETLMGAFHMISTAKQNFHDWYQTGCDLLKEDYMLTFIPITGNPTREIISKLRPLKFFFDPFHSRFFGPAQNKKQAECIIGQDGSPLLNNT